jgi:hypothetical protein
MLNLEISKENLSLIQMLLKKEEQAIRIEIHHARRTFEFRDFLKKREHEIHDLLERVTKLLPEEKDEAA